MRRGITGPGRVKRRPLATIHDFRFRIFRGLLGEPPRLLDVEAAVFGERALCKNSVLEYKPQYFK